MKNIFTLIQKLLFSGHQRSVKVNKNIIASFFIKGVSIVVGFLMVRITLDYLDQTKYGIWLTMSSFLTWFTFFGIGLGNGLRNKLAEALAVKDYHLGKIYVSTTYAILSLIFGGVALIFFIGNQFLDWSKILNTDAALAPELSNLALIVFGFFFLRFVVKLIGIILYADQRPAIANTFGPMGSLLALIVIYILTKTTHGSLLYLGWTLSILPVVVLIIASFYFYNTDYKKIAPNLNFIRMRYAKSLLSLGFKFFIIQVSALVMFQSSNIVIAQFFGPADVTPYNIAYKYYGIINMLFSIIMIPFWSAYTEAWKKKEIGWIKSTINNLLKVFITFVVLGIILFVFSKTAFILWLGRDKMAQMPIPSILQLSLLFYFLIFSFGGIFNMFINGTGKVHVQMIALIIGAILFFPTAWIFVKYFHMGVEGVVFATIISNFYSVFISPIQYYKLINNKAYGIWDK